MEEQRKLVIINSNDSWLNQAMAAALTDIFAGSCEIMPISEYNPLPDTQPAIYICSEKNDLQKTGCITDQTKVIYLENTAKIIRHRLSVKNNLSPAAVKNSEDVSRLPWPYSVSTAAKLISRLLEANNSRSDKNDGEQLPDRRENILCLHLLLGSKDSDSLLRLMLRQLSTGVKILYLPLMPTYQMKMCDPPDRAGPGLSDLLLSFHQKNQPEARQLGLFLQMNRQGYLQFRVPAGSDDLICCDPEYLRQLAALLRTAVKTDQQTACVWIDCRGMALNTVSCIASLCDLVLIETEDRSDFAATEARRELGLFLAGLPGSCQIFEAGSLPNSEADKALLIKK